MSREILFRGKRVDNGEWIRGDLITTPFIRNATQQNIYNILDITKADYDSFEDLVEDNGIFEVDPETVCQYTGLTDKNGRKIFEGDIVQYIDEIIRKEKVDEVKYNETHAAFCRLHKGKRGLQYLFIDEIIANKCEVIGNIFDNPELIGTDGGSVC